jgi:hypothetical protein
VIFAILSLDGLGRIEQHILDTNAGKELSEGCHRCLINTGVKK